MMQIMGSFCVGSSEAKTIVYLHAQHHFKQPESLFWWCGAFFGQLLWKEGYNYGYIKFSNDDILNSKFAQVAIL